MGETLFDRLFRHVLEEPEVEFLEPADVSQTDGRNLNVSLEELVGPGDGLSQSVMLGVLELFENLADVELGLAFSELLVVPHY